MGFGFLHLFQFQAEGGGCQTQDRLPDTPKAGACCVGQLDLFIMRETSILTTQGAKRGSCARNRHSPCIWGQGKRVHTGQHHPPGGWAGSQQQWGGTCRGTISSDLGAPRGACEPASGVVPGEQALTGADRRDPKARPGIPSAQAGRSQTLPRGALAQPSEPRAVVPPTLPLTGSRSGAPAKGSQVQRAPSRASFLKVRQVSSPPSQLPKEAWTCREDPRDEDL